MKSEWGSMRFSHIKQNGRHAPKTTHFIIILLISSVWGKRVKIIGLSVKSLKKMTKWKYQKSHLWQEILFKKGLDLNIKCSKGSAFLTLLSFQLLHNNTEDNAVWESTTDLIWSDLPYDQVNRWLHQHQWLLLLSTLDISTRYLLCQHHGRLQ